MQVKEKETAHREYREAVSKGHGAYLMDQDKERPVCSMYLSISKVHNVQTQMKINESILLRKRCNDLSHV